MYVKLSATSTLTTRNHASLMYAWRTYGKPWDSLVGSFVYEGALTDAERRRLPAGLRAKLVEAPANGR